MIRVGDQLSNRFDFLNNNYFDLTNSSKLNQINQFKTFEKSEFYFGSGAASTLICSFFEKKRVLINIPPSNLSNQTFSFSSKNFIIYKKVFCLKRKKILSIKEIFEDENLFVTEISELVDTNYTSNNINAKKYILIENTEDEIFDLAKEFYDYNFDNQNSTSLEMEEFKKIRSSAINELISKSKKYLNYPSVSLFRNTEISISKNYLKKYLYNSKFLEEESKNYRSKFNI